MGFFQILKDQKNKFSPEDVAIEIVRLEAKLPELEEKLQDAENQAVRLRQAKISGETIADRDLEKVDRDFESARLDLVAVKKTLEELGRKLKTMLEKKRESEKVAIDEVQKRLEERERKAKIGLVKTIALARAMQIYNSEYLEQLPKHGHGDLELRESIYSGSPEHSVFITEVEAKLKEMEKSGFSIRDQKREVDQLKSAAALETGIDEVFMGMLSKARENNLPG